MIRLSVSADRNGIINLWHEAFGDSVEAIELFLNNRYIPENTVVAEENGKIASMLFLLEGKLFVDSVIYNAYYLYAAATLKEFRGRGLMAEMLDFSRNLAKERNVDLICLKPAEDSLYDYYGKFGYKSVFSSKIITVNQILDSDNCRINSEAETDYFTVRDNVFSIYNRFVWDNEAIKYAIKQHKYYEGSVISGCNGYCLYSVENDVCCVKEMCFTSNKLLCILKIILKNSSATTIKIELPTEYQTNSFDYEIKNNGMALPISQKAEAILNSGNIYLNLTLD